MKNLHLTHVEDLMFADPLLPLEIMSDVFAFLNGENGPGKVSVKWDGSPAFVCGNHPETKKFFLGTKSVFSGKINYSHEDIERNHPESQGLRNKLHFLFTALSPLVWNEITQGDMLWCGTAGYHLDGTVQFKPNTLMYRGFKVTDIPYLGAVLHTTYRGDTMETLEAFSGAVVPKHPVTIVLFEPKIPFCSTSEIFREEVEGLFARVSRFEYQVTIPCQQILDVLQKPKVNEILNKYINTTIKYDFQPIPNATDFIWFLQDTYKNHRESLKTEKGKKKVFEEFIEINSKLDKFDLTTVFFYYNMLVKLKLRLIDALNVNTGNATVQLPDGTSCGHEGFVVDYLGTLCKLVYRHCFSKANLTTVKEWQGQ